MNLLIYIIFFILLLNTSCKKYERNTLYFTPPESILCLKDIDFNLEIYTVNEIETNLGYELRIYLRNSPGKYMAIYENNIQVYQIDDSEFSCIRDYFPLSPIKIKGDYHWSRKWKIIYLDKTKMGLKFIDDQGNTHVMYFKISFL